MAPFSAEAEKIVDPGTEGMYPVAMIWKRDKIPDEEKDLSRMSFAEHFEELRKRLVFCVLTVVVLFVVCYIFRDPLIKFVLKPYEDYRARAVAGGGKDPGPLVYIGLPEGFIFHLKTCFLFAIFIGAPVILYQMWQFIGAGLYKKEKKSITRIVPFSVALFMAGLAFGYLVLFPIGMSFLLSFPDHEVLVPSITVSKYFDLFFMMILVMGFMFQAPLIMVVTTSVGLTTPELFSSKRRYFLLGAFVVGALFTPPDAVTQCLLATPLVALFEAGILLSKRAVKKRRAREEAERTGDSSSGMAG
jgi:sec-independent protein translocase protein TatC